MLRIVAVTGGCLVAPLILGMLLRWFLRFVQSDLVSLFSAAVFLFLLDQFPAVAVLRMSYTVEMLFHDPFDKFSTWVVAVIFTCIVLARVAIPFLLARRGVWLVDRFRLPPPPPPEETDDI